MRRRAALSGAALLGSLALFWPGYVMYDSVAQYGQLLSGEYLDWHPPAMARLWSVFGAHGAAPMLALQLGLYWLGLGLIAAASARRVGLAVLMIGAWPVFLGWQGVVLKDGQMIGALLAVAGLIGWWRLRGRPVPWPAVAGVAVLIAYAVLVRSNAVFAAVPLAVLLTPAIRGGVARTAAIGLGVVVVLALLSPINHRLFAARPSGVERTQAIYDLAGIAVRLPPDAAHTGMLPNEAAELAARHCVRPFFWDPLGEPDRCDDTVDRLRHVPAGALYATLADAILHHPIAYVGHRLAHLNSTERWLVPWRWPSAAPPLASEPNDEGLGSPARVAGWWQRLAGWLIETPLGWPLL
ncbi:hypothetical protein, partial [Sphingomonas bacterium]|uniref:hypothetical protein n=1 Tax=Sphingomonas bacterium TaxID=1895847 RepID=UPI001575FB02